MNYFGTISKRSDLLQAHDTEIRAMVPQSKILGYLSVLTPITKTVSGISGLFWRSSGVDIVEHLRDLETVMLFLSPLEAKDPRDRVNAALALTKGHVPIMPDYSRTWIQVCSDVVLHCAKTTSSLDIICRPWGPSLHSNVQQDVPSWISSSIEDEYVLKIAKRLVGAPGKPIYNTASRSMVTFSSKSPYFDGDIFNVFGTQLGHVSGISPTCTSFLIPSPVCQMASSTSDHASFWRVLITEKGLQGESMPTWYQRVAATMLKRLNGYGVLLFQDVLKHASNYFLRKYLERTLEVVPLRRLAEVTFSESFGETGALGMVPERTEMDDEIYLICGCSVPVVMRKDDDGIHKIIGECYVDGVMEGELAGLPKPDLDIIRIRKWLFKHNKRLMRMQL